MWKHCRIWAGVSWINWSLKVWVDVLESLESLFPSSWRINSVCRIIFLVWMAEGMQETAGFDLYVLLVKEMQIQPLFWHHVEYWIHLNETNSDVCMYTSIIYFICWRTCSTWKYMLYKWMMILEWDEWMEFTLAYIHMQQWNCSWMTIDRLGLIELQRHEKLSLMRTNVWIAIPMLASRLTPLSVNWNLCWLLITQTARETCECHSFN